MPAAAPLPVEVTLHERSGVLELRFDDGAVFRLPFELMRVFSPSAEVRGHGVGQEVLVTGKRAVRIVALEPVGHYALRPTFSDGHDSGLFTWAYLYELGQRQEALWQEYESRLAQAEASRGSPTPG